MSSGTQNSALLKCGVCDLFRSSAPNDRFVNSHCGHIFHEACIKRWIQENLGNRCPLDKKRIELEKLVPVYGYDPSDRELKIKIAVLGDHGVGKSCLVRRFQTGVKNMNVLTTVSCDLFTRNLLVDYERINLNIYDPPGQERFHQSIIPQCLRDCHGIIFCYDPTHYQSLVNLNRIWRQYATRYVRQVDDFVSIFLECKNDLTECNCTKKGDLCRPVTDAEKTTAKQFLGIELFTTSALNSSDSDLEAPFIHMVRQILRREKLMEQILNDSLDTDRVQLTEDDGEQEGCWEKFKSKCC